jgi:CheY-like chemotaxis protein
LTRRALEGGSIPHQLFIVEDGEEALDFLHHRGKFSHPQSSPRPDLMLLDLNMPRMDGKQVLKHVRSDPNLRRLPVVVLTTSREDDDVLRSYDLGVNSYLSKTSDVGRLTQLIHALESYWFKVVVLPPS